MGIRSHTQLRANLKLIGETAKRDQEHVKVYELQIKTLHEEIRLMKNSIEEHQALMNQRKGDVVEITKKYQAEIQFYQDKIEKMENDHRRRVNDLKDHYEGLLHNLETQMKLKTIRATTKSPLKRGTGEKNDDARSERTEDIINGDDESETYSERERKERLQDVLKEVDTLKMMREKTINDPYLADIFKVQRKRRQECFCFANMCIIIQ
eukprot:TRINITY_DN950_c0_g1_i2.p2 TRINITY_DN950_c0_g1~~TRINITY_DN950_c0_g1_i2.p2  ORF type:complete len:209 (+),score=33.23 TRINITY_DN950_c0_g1_i2:107-733(+)